MSTPRYLINDLYYTIQGEGLRAGTAAVFVRFAKCNLKCNVAQHGFDCDTEFETGAWYELDELCSRIYRADTGACRWIVFTGGEPTLQLDIDLLNKLDRRGFRFAIETNGTQRLACDVECRLDWICCSPKPGTTVLLRYADEVKCVLAAGQKPDAMGMRTRNLLVSPAFKGDEPDPDAIAWCVQWVKENPDWRLSLQTHKFICIP